MQEGGCLVVLVLTSFVLATDSPPSYPWKHKPLPPASVINAGTPAPLLTGSFQRLRLTTSWFRNGIYCFLFPIMMHDCREYPGLVRA